MNDLSIMLPLLVKARASAEAQRVGGARSPGPRSRPQSGPQGCTADRCSSLFLFLRATGEFGLRGILTGVQRFDLRAGDSAYQGRARQCFSLSGDKSSPSARFIKHQHHQDGGWQRPRVGHLVLGSFPFP